LGERLLCKQEVVGSIPSASRWLGCGRQPGGCAGLAVSWKGLGLGFGCRVTAVGRGLALGA